MEEILKNLVNWTYRWPKYVFSIYSQAWGVFGNMFSCSILRGLSNQPRSLFWIQSRRSNYSMHLCCSGTEAEFTFDVVATPHGTYMLLVIVVLASSDNSVVAVTDLAFRRSKRWRFVSSPKYGTRPIHDKCYSRNFRDDHRNPEKWSV